MSGLCRCLKSGSLRILSEETVSRCLWFVAKRTKFHKTRLPKELFPQRSKEHEKYGGDPDQPHKLHIVTRVKSVIGRPYWEKDAVKYLGLTKPHTPVIHKNIQSVNEQLKHIKHLVKIEPLKTPYGLPSEQDMADSFINSKGELIVRRLLQPVEVKAVES